MFYRFLEYIIGRFYRIYLKYSANLWKIITDGRLKAYKQNRNNMEKEDFSPILMDTGKVMKQCVDVAIDCVTVFMGAYQAFGNVKDAFTDADLHKLLIKLVFHSLRLHHPNVARFAHTIVDMLLQDLLPEDIYEEASFCFFSILQKKVAGLTPVDPLITVLEEN